MASDLEPVVGIVARRTGHDPDVVRDVLQEAWGILKAQQEWDVSDAFESGIRVGLATNAEH